MRVSSWNRAKMETDCENLILLRCLTFHSAYAHVLSSPEHHISAVARRQEKMNQSQNKSMSFVLAGAPGGENGPELWSKFLPPSPSKHWNIVKHWHFLKKNPQSMFANTLNCLSRLNLHHVLWSAFQLVLAAASILADWRTVHEQIWHFHSAHCPLMLTLFDTVRVFKC